MQLPIKIGIVLILVLVEVTLWGGLNLNTRPETGEVLILVLVEVTLWAKIAVPSLGKADILGS